MESMPRIAGLLGIEYLYHYDKFDRDRIRDILKEHRIFCSNPAGSNDPWDCRPYFDPDLVMDAETHAAEAEHFIAGQRGGPKGDRYDDAIRKSPFILKSLIKDFSKDFNDMIPNRWGVYCLAKCGRNSLMWSHYSRNHTGICLEFAAQNTKLGFAYEVDYNEDYPPFLLHKQTSRPTILLSKSDVWKYEEEYRLICPRETIYPNHPLLMEGDYLRIGATDLKAIIVGCQASDDTIRAATELLSEFAPHVELKQARRSPNKYRLEIERLSHPRT
jgi:hypothetical protein